MYREKHLFFWWKSMKMFSVFHDLSESIYHCRSLRIMVRIRNKIIFWWTFFQSSWPSFSQREPECLVVLQQHGKCLISESESSAGEPTFERRQYNLQFSIDPSFSLHSSSRSNSGAKIFDCKNYLWRQFLGGYYFDIFWIVRDLKLLQWSGHKVNSLWYDNKNHPNSADSRIVFMNIWNVWVQPSALLSWLELNNHFPADAGPQFPMLQRLLNYQKSHDRVMAWKQNSCHSVRSLDIT